jgi:acyl-CoA synthetase (AMP-forming)/AMP-acid ligase II
MDVGVMPAFTLANLIREHARERPDAVALVCGDTRRTFAELHARSSRAAGALLEAGVQPGDRVALLMKNTLEYFELVFACSKIDATVVALNWRLAAPEIAGIDADAAPRVLVADAEHVGLVPSRPDLRVILLGDEYERLLAAAPADDPSVPSGSDRVALILYSSGTTGRPKGVMLTNENLSYSRIMARELFRMRDDCVHLVASPLFHVGGIGTGMTSVRIGGRTVILADASPQLILDTIARERVTHAFFVPAVIQALVDLAVAEPRDLSSLQVISYGAAPMTEALLRRAIEVLGCGFLQCYGMTETAGTVVALPPEEHVSEGPLARLLRSVGRPLPWLEVRVSDLQTGEEAPPGQVGEIWVRSAQNAKGYWNQPDATTETLVAGGWLRTGDGAFRDEEGYFFLQDRLKDMIISGGENVYPAEVENALADHPGVADVAVIGVPHERWGETVKAVVVPREGVDVDAEQLTAFARERLARYKCPTSVDFVSELPRTASGKVLKKALREEYA